MPDVLIAVCRFAATERGLHPDFRDEVLSAVEGVRDVYLQRMGDPAGGGPAKAIMSHLLSSGVDITDPDAVERAMASLDLASLDLELDLNIDDLDLDDPDPDDLSGFNDLFDEPGPNLGSPAVEAWLSRGSPTRMRPAGPPGPPDPTLVDQVADCVAVVRLDQVAEFYGDGRKLTKTGLLEGTYYEDRDYRLQSGHRTVEELVEVLGWARLIRREGSHSAPDPVLHDVTRTMGGALHLSDAGRWWAATVVASNR